MYRTLALFLCLCSTSLFSQSTATLDAPTLVTQVAATFSSVPIQGVQLSGTAQAYAGSEQPSGTFTYQINADGHKSLRLDIGDLSRTDTTGAFGDVTACRDTDAKGMSHVTADHNCLLPLDWVLPVLGLQSQVANLELSLADVTDPNGVKLHKLSIDRPAKEGSTFALQITKHLSHMDYEVDPASLLVTSIDFTEHPEQDASTDFAIEVRYSDYRTVNGVRLPFHVQKYARGGLVLDLQAENATVQ